MRGGPKAPESEWLRRSLAEFHPLLFGRREGLEFQSVPCEVSAHQLRFERFAMVRVPDTGPAARGRDALIRKLERDLARFNGIPATRREAECADEGAETCRALLAELYSKRLPPKTDEKL